MPNVNPKADILIVTVAKVESQAVMKVFREAIGIDPKPVPISDRIYHNLGEVNGARIFMALSEMGAGGLGASQQAVQKGIRALRPLAVILVGVAFGVNEQKQAIGDVLVSKQLWLYDLQRIGKNEIVPRGDKPHASGWLVDYLRSADLYWQGAKVRFGLVLTGEKLVDNVDYRDQLKKFEPEVIGGEMEGAGLYVACQDAHVDWILVKAICDWADSNKAQDKDARQQLAAYNAASFVLHALQQASLTEEKTDIYRNISSTSLEHQELTTDDKMARARALGRRARIAYQESNYADAEELLRLAVQLDPEAPGYWGLFGRVLSRLGKYNEATSALSRAIELTQVNRSLYLLHRGIAYTMSGQYGRALDDFDNRLKLSPKSHRTLRWRAMVWLYLHRPENALADVSRAIDLKPEYICAHATKAIALCHRRQMEDASKELDIIDALHPEDEGDFYCLALAYSQLKTPREAIDALRIAVERDPRYIARSAVEPFFEQLRDDPYFQQVIKKA